MNRCLRSEWRRVLRKMCGSAGTGANGMRAVSMHIFQSESVLNLLRPGSRVDLQAVSDKNGAAELRTVLENVQVLAVSSADANGNRPAGAVVTVLIRAQDTDMVALADAGSRIRVALRNPMDEGTTPRHSLDAGRAVFGQQQGQRRTRRNQGVRRGTCGLGSSDPTARPGAGGERCGSGGIASPVHRSYVRRTIAIDSWRVAAFRSGEEAAKLIQSLEQKHQLEVVSSERLMAGVGRPISYRAGAKPYQLRVQFSPEWLAHGKLGLRVKPQIGRLGRGCETTVT